MNASSADSLLVKPGLVPATTVSTVNAAISDVNENNATKSPHLLTPSASPRLLTPSAMNDGTVPHVASPVTSMPFSQVSSPPNIMAFPTGINLTISNGIINVKSPCRGESTLLVAPATSLSSSSLSSCASTPSPITVVKGTMPVMTTPASSITMTTPSLLGSTPATLGTLKVAPPGGIQLRPPVYGTLQGSNMMAMHSRLQLPFQTAPAQTFTVPTSLTGTLRALAPGCAPQSSPVMHQQVQFQTVAPLRGTAVTIATGSHQQAINPQMNIRSAAAFPLLFNRPIAFNQVASRPQMMTAQPTRLAPRQMGPQVALQVAGPGGLSGVQGATLMGPLFRPAQHTHSLSKPMAVAVSQHTHSLSKPMAVAVSSPVCNPGLNPALPASQQAQFVNQVMATATMPGMTHISLRPSTQPLRPQKLPDARLMTGLPVNRLIRPGQITITTLSSTGLGLATEPLVTASQGIPIPVHTSAGMILSVKADTNTPEKNPPESSLVGQPQVRLPVTSLQSAGVTSFQPMNSLQPAGMTSFQPATSFHQPVTTLQPVSTLQPGTTLQPVTSLQPVATGQDGAVVSKQGSTPTLLAKSPAGKDATPKAEAPAGTEGQKGEATEAPAPVTTSEFDALKVMDWSDGIASLPGSNFKFKVNEFGLMEMVTEDSPGAVKMVVDTAVGVNTADFSAAAAASHATDGVSDAQAETPNKEKEPLKQCENCGKYGYLRDFCKTGRFCSQACVGAFAGRKNKQAGQSLLSSKTLVSLKKKQRKVSGEDGGGQVVVITPPQAPGATAETDTGPDKDKLFSVMPNKKVKGFDWPAFLDQQKAVGAPLRCFRDPFPTQKNGFKTGMRLEGVDPKHQNLFCVLSVAETQGYRLRLHFDGYSECYDFWCNADSPFIFPVGWCEKNNKPLLPPKQIPRHSFSWATYLRTTKSVAASKNLFVHQTGNVLTPSAFRVGMKLEAVDRKNTALICVATVADVLVDRVLIHFDSWEDVYDYWCDTTSPYIHPVGWCQENARTLSPPCDWTDIETFTWEDYLTQTKTQAVPARAFKPRPPMGFEPGMKVEVVDRRNPIMVRVGSVREAREHQVRVHFDGWPDVYDYWLDDDSPDIKPPTWCQRTGHALQPNFVGANHVMGSCPTPGCNGVGHIKGAKYVGHHSAFGCPYSSLNMNKESTLQDRLGSTRVEEGAAAPLSARVKMESGEIRKCPTFGCDSSGHITGKFTSHHRLSGCPLYEKNVLRMNAELAAKSAVRPGRGRKRKHFHFSESDMKEESSHRIKRERVDSQVSFMETVHQSVFMSTVPATPSQEGPPFWEYHAKLLPGVAQVRGHHVRGWGVHQVSAFVGSLPGCREHEKTFRDQEIDGDSFLLLTQADIVRIMNVKLGPALKIFNSIILFQQTTES